MTTVDLEERSPRAGLLPRFIVFGLIVVLIVAALSIRLFYLQVGNGGYYTGLADSNRIVLQAIPSTRGLIYDRTGRQLVQNVPTFTVKIRPADLPFSQREQVVGRLSTLLVMPSADINQAIDQNPGSRFDQVRVAVDVPEDVARVIAEEHLSLPGVEVTVEARRDYLYGPLVSQLLGYTGPVDVQELQNLAGAGYLPDDLIGKSGVEASYESQLRGTYGQEQVERDALGRKVSVLSQVQAPVAGDSLQLTIDVGIQKEAQQALEWGLKAAGLKSGVFIVMNPQTGEILAMVSLPTYDDNLFARGISNKDFQALASNTFHPLLNHAIGEQYAPGSTYKLVAGTGVLADGKITASTLVQTYPYLDVAGHRFYDWNKRGFGRLPITLGFAHSSDTFFYQMAQKLGIDRLGYWAKQYGFGAPTGVDLPGEAAGIVPTNAWKQEALGSPIYPGETVLAGIGQGYDAVTPLQLLNAYCALANGGKVLQPQIVREVLGPDGQVVRPFAPKVINTLPVSQAVLRTMRVGARSVLTVRHTFNFVDLPVVVAGKSGTAEFGHPDAKGRQAYSNWFAGFVPKNAAKTSADPGGFKAVSRTDSPLAFLAFAFDSNTKGNAATEIAKYFVQIHFHTKVDLRLNSVMQRGNFIGQE
jgi:penicillin-binding protein 2